MRVDSWVAPDPKRKEGGHCCRILDGSQIGLYGPAASECWEDQNGAFWLDNGEYMNTVNFCPYCGCRSRNPIMEDSCRCHSYFARTSEHADGCPLAGRLKGKDGP